jgi:uncharacterized Zn finger protein (UPF0148 family)
MSDFDKEAERRKLREKYESEQEDREATQRMSELLLQGATMTNRHCDTCGDPIFRYEGQEFCPTCQAAAAESVASEEETGDDAAAADGAAGSAADAGQASPAADEAKGTDASGGKSHAAGDVVDSHHTPEAGPSLGDQSSGDAGAAESGGSGGRAAASTGTRTVTGGDLGEARASLVRNLTRLSQAAESVDDPRRAREYLAAAREAAEAVAALDRT